MIFYVRTGPQGAVRLIHTWGRRMKLGRTSSLSFSMRHDDQELGPQYVDVQREARLCVVSHVALVFWGTALDKNWHLRDHNRTVIILILLNHEADDCKVDGGGVRVEGSVEQKERNCKPALI